MLTQQQGGRRNPPASAAQIAQLPTHEVTVVPKLQEGQDATEDDRVSCMVCICEKEIGETVRTLPCMHSFHAARIDQWLAENRTCPICKTDIVTGMDQSGESADATRDADSNASSPISQRPSGTGHNVIIPTA